MNRATRRAKKFQSTQLSARSREQRMRHDKQQQLLSNALAASAKERLAKLVEDARSHIQRELDATLRPDFPKNIDLTLLLLDGESVFAEFGPPELKSVPGAFAARIVRADELVHEAHRLAPPIVAGLKSKRCSSDTEFSGSNGHVRFLVSTGTGNMVGCTKCSWDMEPTL